MKGVFIRVTVNMGQQHSNSAWDNSHKTSITTTKKYRVIKIYIVQPLSQWVPFQGKHWLSWEKRKHNFGDVNYMHVLALLINTESFHTVNIIKAHNSRTETCERSPKRQKAFYVPFPLLLPILPLLCIRKRRGGISWSHFWGYIPFLYVLLARKDNGFWLFLSSPVSLPFSLYIMWRLVDW